MLKKFNWYCLTYSFHGSVGSGYVGLELEQGKKIKIKDIEKGKEAAKMDRNSVLINAIYLGEMTKDELTTSK